MIERLKRDRLPDHGQLDALSEQRQTLPRRKERLIEGRIKRIGDRQTRDAHALHDRVVMRRLVLMTGERFTMRCLTISFGIDLGMHGGINQPVVTRAGLSKRQPGNHDQAGERSCPAAEGRHGACNAFELNHTSAGHHGR